MDGTLAIPSFGNHPMRLLLASLFLCCASLQPAMASIVLGGTAVDPTFSTTVAIVTDTSLNPLGALFLGTNALIETNTLDAALLTDTDLDATLVGASFDMSQFVALTLSLPSFSGLTINAVGVPLTPLTNFALIGILGDVQLGLELTGVVPVSETALLLAYNVTSITQIPEPATLGLCGGALMAFSLMRRRRAR